jgi:hypothetical protein
MNDSIIQDLTQQLDRAIPREGAIVRLEADIEPPYEAASQFRIIANRAGYLRLGVACLQAASAPYSANDRAMSDAIQSAAGDLFGENADDPSVRFERTEHLQPQREEYVPPDWRLQMIEVAGLVGVALALYCFLAGAMALGGSAMAALAALGS